MRARCSPRADTRIVVLLGTALTIGTACNTRLADEDCEPYANDSGDGSALEVVIVNRAQVPIFVPPSGGCSETIPLHIADADGELQWLQPYGTCEELFTNDCAYPADCAAGATIRIDPGGTYSTSWAKTRFETIEMPATCFAHPGNCAPTCQQEQPVADGTYTFSATAGTQIGQCAEVPADCECTPNADGWCEIWNVWESATDLETVAIDATLPTAEVLELVFE